MIQRMTKSVVQTCNRYVTTQIGCSLVWFGLIVGSWYEQFQGPAVPSTLYGQLWQMSPPSMVIGQLAITCIYYGFVGLARCMKHLNNSQHIPYLQGSRLQRRCAGVPRCQRRVPQVQKKESVNKSQDAGKRRAKPRKAHWWMGFWPKLGEGGFADGQPRLWCEQTNGMSTATTVTTRHLTGQISEFRNEIKRNIFE